MQNFYRRTESKRPIGRLYSRSCEGDIEINLRELGVVGMQWIRLANVKYPYYEENNEY
jgi:hypothetical protein